MLRLCGCLLLMIAGTAAGFVKAGAVRAHTAELRRSADMLREISELIRYRRSTKSEIMRSLESSGRYGELVRCRSELLSSEELLPLSEAMSQLGTTDAEGQLSILGLAAARCESLAAEAAAVQRERCRLCEVLGFMAGAFAAVMLV